MTRQTTITLALLGLTVVAGCDDTTGPAAGGVAVAFATSSAGAPQGSSLTLQGTNGTLVIDDLRIIVERFQLDRDDDDLCMEEDHSCERFRAAPAFIDVPLNGSSTVAVTQDVEPGAYKKLRFEIEDLDDDADNATEAAQISALFTRIRQEFPNWPRDASMLVTGTFTPTGGTPQPFAVFFEAEVEIEMEFVPPAVITDDAARFTVMLDPALWFRHADGSVRNLALLNGQLVEFEAEAEDGFVQVRFDD